MLKFPPVYQQVNDKPPSRASLQASRPSQIQLFVNVQFVLNLGHLNFEIVSDFDIRISDFSLSSAFGRNSEFQSIKNNKLCETNPISKKPKMNLTYYSIKNYENKSGLLTMEKQTQSNPTCSELVEPISEGALAQSRGLLTEGKCAEDGCGQHIALWIELKKF